MQRMQNYSPSAGAEPGPSKPRRPPRRESSQAGKQPAHILTACARCRERKTKCDARLPRCGPCKEKGASCYYYDAAKKRMMPRSYVLDLQAKVSDLERELKALRVGPEATVPVEDLVRGGGNVKIRSNAESRFLGPSSGIAMTRLVMELARSFTRTKSIKEIIPEDMAQHVRQRFEEEFAKPMSKIYPLNSNIAAPELPPQSLTDQLVEDYIIKAQTFYPILHEPTFRQDVKDVYHGSEDPYKNFTVRIVIALSMHRNDAKWSGLADSFYLAALQFLEGTVRRRNLGTLQCFALIAGYSLTTPTRTASYWVVGLAAKLLQELRMTDEATIAIDEHGKPLDPLQVDMRRRLFYICVNMELALAHSLGRPSAFSVTANHKDIKFYSNVDDKYIMPSGIAPEAPPTLKKRMSIHFHAMRWIQLEIRHTLYLNKRPTPLNDEDPWFRQIEDRVETWIKNCPKPLDGSRSVEEWFRVEYNTIIVFIFRPSPQVPEPSMYAVRRCFKAAVHNIYSQRAQVESNHVDVTWVFAQQLFMAINTVLWALSYSELRMEQSREKVSLDLDTALTAIYKASLKWPGVESALALYTVLVEYCLKTYDGDAELSYGAASPLNKAWATSPQSVDSLPIINTPETVYSTVNTGYTSAPSTQARSVSHDSPSLNNIHNAGDLPDPTQYAHVVDYGLSPRSNMAIPSPQFSHASYDSSTFFQPLPSPQSDLLQSFMQNSNYMLGTTTEPYMPYFAFAQPEPMEGINLEEQFRLMQHLEAYGLGTPPSMTSPRNRIVT